MSTTYYAEDYDVLADGTYPAKLTRIEESDQPGPYGDFLTWTFQAEVDGSTADVTGRTSTSFRPSTKARNWYEALLGTQLVKGDAVDFDLVIGTPCLLRVSTVEKDKGTFNRIESIRRRGAVPKPLSEVAAHATEADQVDFDSLPF